MACLALKETARESARERAARLAGEAGALSAAEILELAIRREFPGRIALVSSFGVESAALLHLVAEVDRAIPVLFLETGKHFLQTLEYRKKLSRELGLTDVRDIAPDTDELAAEDSRGDLWRRDSDACCSLRKVRPLKDALSGFDAWITGRKRFHGSLRAFLPVFEASERRIKVNPLARWSAQELSDYHRGRGLPAHPLVEQGFRSIGCWPCTGKAGPEEHLRAGRWRGLEKSECGIHRL